LESGRLVERGTHEELLRMNGRYAALYRLQLGSPKKTGAERSTALAALA
jgi:hypothetical protein